MQRVALKLHEALRRHPTPSLEALLLRSSWRWVHVRTVPFLFRAGARIWQQARAGAVDIVLFSSMVTATLAVPLRHTLQAGGVTTATIAHGLDVTTAVPPYQWFVPRVFRALDAVLPVSHATAAACRERGLAPEKVHVVPNGIDLDRFAPPGDRAAERRALAAQLAPTTPLPDDALLLCSVGRHVERKGLAWFVDRVMPRLPDDVHYWIAGDGPRTEAIRAAITRHGLEGRVRLLGRIPDDQLSTLYRGSDLFVMPNVPVAGDMEGFGVVMLEAGLAGCPVIASRLEGIQDVVEEGVNGHLVPPETPAAFVDAICGYRNQPGRLAAAADRAAEHVASTYSWSSVADRYVETLASIRRQNAARDLHTP
jgi:phosphatidylinositol alpha-1,6-mannosyltransferase